MRELFHFAVMFPNTLPVLNVLFESAKYGALPGLSNSIWERAFGDSYVWWFSDYVGALFAKAPVLIRNWLLLKNAWHYRLLPQAH
jgi:hypothetical protein